MVKVIEVIAIIYSVKQQPRLEYTQEPIQSMEARVVWNFLDLIDLLNLKRHRKLKFLRMSMNTGTATLLIGICNEFYIFSMTFYVDIYLKK